MRVPVRQSSVVLLWDIDGTLLRGSKAAIAAWQAAVQVELEADIDWRALDTSGATDVSIALQICAQAGREATAITSLLARYVEELALRLQEDPAIALPNAREVLAHVTADSDYANLLLTGNLRRAAQAKLSSCGLAEFCRDGAFGESGPERNQVAAAARRLVSAIWGDTVPLLVIGDTPRDIAAARFIGAAVLAIASGNHAIGSLARHRPDYLLPALPQPEAFIEIVEQMVAAWPGRPAN
ncbi:MAG: haloacid dehalogenase-like hydrolase [Candidatus Competibacteraceae bacterium]